MQFQIRFLLLLGASVATTQGANAAQTTPGTTPPQAPNAAQPAPNGALPTPSAATASAGNASQAQVQSDEDDIVVAGKPPRGSVIGDIPPINVLSSRDVKATGATNFDELLDAIAPDIGVALGAGGGRPLVLLNGHRVSSYRELRDLPIEAISRVDILPEEVALKYGAPPDQKVVNVVLQKRFSETVGQISANTAAHHGYTGGSGDVTRLVLSPNQRTNLNLHAGTSDILRGSQRELVEQQYESSGTGDTGLLLPPELGIRATGTVDRQLPGDIDGTLNFEADHSNGHLLNGLSDQVPSQLQRQTINDRLHVGGTLTGDNRDWHWNVTSNADFERDRTSTIDLGQAFAPGNAQTLHADGNVDATANGPLFATAQGNADVTLHAAASGEYLDADEENFPNAPSGSISRSTLTAGANFDLPISRRGRSMHALGNLSLNVNAEANELSDFGLLSRVGAGANWSPVVGLNLVGSWSRQDQAPSIRQLGDPFVETPGTQIFDFTNGVVTRAAVLAGGNPALRTDRRNTFEISANWQPSMRVDFRLRADYAHVDIDHPIADITVSPELEQAFPDRFVRDSSGNLLSVDLRPVNFERASRDALRLGFDFTKPLKSMKVSAADVQRLIDQARAAGINVPGGPIPAATPDSLGSIAPSNGRLTFSLTDTVTIVDRAVVGPNLPVLDYLHGAPIGEGGGQPRHQVQAQVGISNYGMGARIGANWRSATSVDTLTGDTLHFSPVATFDLRLFANVGQYIPIVSHHPWLRGASMRFEVGNVFDTRPNVRTTGGAVPIGYLPTMLDPLGRTFMLTFRKQFLPASYYERALENFEKRQTQPQ